MGLLLCFIFIYFERSPVKRGEARKKVLPTRQLAERQVLISLESLKYNYANHPISILAPEYRLSRAIPYQGLYSVLFCIMY